MLVHSFIKLSAAVPQAYRSYRVNRGTQSEVENKRQCRKQYCRASVGSKIQLGSWPYERAYSTPQDHLAEFGGRESDAKKGGRGRKKVELSLSIVVT